MSLSSSIDPQSVSPTARIALPSTSPLSSNEDRATTVQPKRVPKRRPETTLYSLQAKQVKLLEAQSEQLTRIGNLLEERNRIEQEKLSKM